MPDASFRFGQKAGLSVLTILTQTLDLMARCGVTQRGQNVFRTFEQRTGTVIRGSHEPVRATRGNVTDCANVDPSARTGHCHVNSPLAS